MYFQVYYYWYCVCVYVRVQTNQKVLLYLFKKELNAFFLFARAKSWYDSECWRLEIGIENGLALLFVFWINCVCNCSGVRRIYDKGSVKTISFNDLISFVVSNSSLFSIIISFSFNKITSMIVRLYTCKAR